MALRELSKTSHPIFRLLRSKPPKQHKNDDDDQDNPDDADPAMTVAVAVAAELAAEAAEQEDDEDDDKNQSQVTCPYLLCQDLTKHCEGLCLGFIIIISKTLNVRSSDYN